MAASFSREIPVVDLEGNSRGLGIAPDAGALEYCGSCSVQVFFDGFEDTNSLSLLNR